MSNLDNFYNKKLQNREFEFKDSYWEDAERLIIEDEKKRRTGGYFWFLGLLLILVIGGAAFWIGSSKPEVTERKALTSKKSSEMQSTIAKEQDQSIQKSNDQPSKSESKSSELSVISSNSSDYKTTNSNPSNVNTDSQIKPENQTAKNKVLKNSKTNNIQNLNSLEKATQILEVENVDKTFQNDQKSTVQLKNEIVENASNEAISEEIGSVSILLPIATLFDEIDSPEHPKLKKVNLPKTNKFKFGLTASSLFYPATNNEKSWIGASFGLVGQFKFLKKISLNTELLYTFRTGTFGTSMKSDQTFYGFGKQTVTYSEQPKNSHFLELPIFVQYHLGRHGIEGGLSLSYLVGVLGNIEKETSLYPWERTDGNNVLNENYASGVISKEGFNAFNTSLLLGYKYSLSQNFMLGFRSAYRFGELVKTQDNNENVLLESGPVNFNISVTWFFLK